jgi:Spy/CpxP family protein refolding chaperone
MGMFGRFIVLTLTFAAAGIAQAQDDGDWQGQRGRGMHHGPMGDPTRMLQMMSRHLDLDETQSQQVSNILGAAKPEIDALRDALHENREAMRVLSTNDPDYSSKLQNLSASNAEIAAQMTLLHGRIRAEMHAVLTTEQLQKIEERAWKDGRHQRRHDGQEPAQ